MKRITIAIITLFSLLPQSVWASAATAKTLNLNMTDSNLGILALIIFVIAYLFVMSEELIHLRKSKPVVFAAGLIWVIVAHISLEQGIDHGAAAAVRHNLLEYAELFLFLLVAMTYVNAMEERLVFENLRSWLVRRGLTYRQLFWVTGLLAFVISPIADNLTTALLMCAVVMAVGGDNRRFISVGCINIVVAANAGGAFSPFGDITTLMVWQKGILGFFKFFAIFMPAVISYLIPAAFMQMAIPKEVATGLSDRVTMKLGAKGIMLLFLLTILTAVSFHNFLQLPPVIGMMTGLGYLNFYAYYIKKREEKIFATEPSKVLHPFDIFNKVKRAEWDTLFFFYGVILCVGGLATLGYLELVSNVMYTQWGASLPAIHSATPANFTVGILSAIVDNIPVMFAVLTMHPTMSEGQWLLVTLTAGIGGSLLSIGSAAGVALMGQAKGYYTFFSHLKWTWAIFLGYVAAVALHIWINGALF